MKNFGLAWLMTLVQSSVANILMVNSDQSKVVELSPMNPKCKLYTRTSDVERMLEIVDPHFVHPMDDNALHDAMTACQNLKGPAHMFIYPGTKWCGPGNIASSYEDIGKYAAEDKCCRDHDLCPEDMPSGKCIDGVCNRSPFTRSSCKCDADFKKCLRHVNTPTANTLGTIFFNVAKVMCFQRNCTEDGKCKTTFSAVSKYPVHIPKREITVNFLTNIFQDFIKNLFKHKSHFGRFEEVI
ncbi:unnamed protein product [Bemisia tabaci]|uniref:Phospholipase A2 n=1 Tax=Bemisia tabaci TaxID=7038 RepID=A0A9P0CFE2_BEMTA|nr:PREDICTED: phospholipase A2-like isoform X1 [Bemisia tabaci]XP_018909500.1 PREDICTED: phospholipase A2-like isoform X2 [Bemisia tabaci]CAH0777132.1 unnamed protein product [Bemisia tabaci]